MADTEIIWSESLQARIRVEVPGGLDYDKHFWDFVDPADAARHSRRMAEAQAKSAAAAKADARHHCQLARIARAEGRRRLVVEHLTEAVRLTRAAHRLGEQARLNLASATKTAATHHQAAE